MVKACVKLRSIGCWTAVFAALAVIGCGSSTPTAPPATSTTAVAQVAPSGTPPMMPQGGGAPGTAPTMPGMGHAQPANPGGGGAAPAMDPASMMKAHGQGAPGAAPSNAPPAGADMAAMMKAQHGQGAPGAAPANVPPGGADMAAMMKAHGQGGQNPPGLAGNPGAAMPPGAPPGGANGPMPPGQFAGAGQNPGGGAGGAGQASKFPEGSAEDAVLKFCTGMAEDNVTAAAESISSKAKGILGQIRDGSISDDKLDGMKSSFGLNGMQLISSRNVGAGKLISLGNSKNEVLSFTLAKEGDEYKLREFKISKVRPNALQGNNF